MPVYDQGYTRWKGELRQRPLRWWPILRRNFLAELRKRRTLFLLVLAWSVILVRGVVLYGDLRSGGLLQSSGLLSTGMPYFYKAATGQGAFVLLFVLLSGTELISKDRRFNALQIYFSRPLTPNDYILGKLGIVSAFVFLVSWLPVLVLWLFSVAVSTQEGYFATVWTAPLSLTAYCVVWALVAGLLILVLSSVARRSAIIAVSWVLLYGVLVIHGVTSLVSSLTHWPYWDLIDIDKNVKHLGAWFFGVQGPAHYSPLWSFALLILVVLGCYVLLRRRIRPVEVAL